MLRRMKFACLAVVALAIAGGTSGAVAAGPAHGVQSRAAVAVGAPTVGATQRLALLRTADLSTRAGARGYLRAIGLDPRKVVVQRGHKNYAGTTCPGKGWSCTS